MRTRGGYTPTGGGECEIVTTTRAALRALRTASGLDLCTVYKFPVTQAGGGGMIHLRAIDVNVLPSNVHWEHPTLTAGTAWPTYYDIDADEMQMLHDPVLNNTVYEEQAIGWFPWGNANLRNNWVNDARITYTSGIFDSNKVYGNARVILNGTARNNTFGELSNFTINGGNWDDSSIGKDANVTINSGSHYENEVGSSSTVNQVGTGVIRYNEIGGNSTITLGNTNLQNNEIHRTTLNSTGATGNINENKFNEGVIDVRNCPSVTINDCRLDSYFQVRTVNATRIYMLRSNASSGGRLLVSAGARLDSSYDKISSYGYINVTLGTLLSTYNTVSNYHYIQHSSTGLNRAARNHRTSNGYIRFLNTTNNNRVHYTSGSSNGRIDVSGTTTNSYYYYNHLDSNSYSRSLNCVNGRYYYNHFDSNAKGYFDNNTTTHYAYYCHTSSNSRLDILNNTGSVRMFSIATDSQSIARIANTAVSGRLYYSSFSSYYYCLSSFTVAATRFGWRGYGRRTYNVVGNTVGNGTFTQNF